MGVFQKYFEYEMVEEVCGFPYIILEGNYKDYEKIISKAEQLRKYKFEWYIDRIIPHIKKMVEAKKGNIDYEFFKNFVQDKIEYESIDSCDDESGHEDDYERDDKSHKNIYYISGWILSFFAYYGDNGDETEKLKPFMENSIKIELFKNLADQILKVPFKFINSKGQTFFLKYNVGFIGCDQNEKKEVFPVIGWIVSPDNKDKKQKDSWDDEDLL